MRRILAILLISVFLVGISSYSYAADKSTCTAPATPMTKLGRGLTNIITAPVEIPKQIILTGKKYNLVIGLLAGTAKGVGFGALRAGMGVLDTVTFFMPKYDRVIVKPEYVFQDWQ